MRGGETREAIVAAADDIFYRSGFENTSFADIAEAVSISRGNFYYHFKTKDEILQAVIERRLAATREMLDRWEEEAADPAGRICCFVRILIANQAQIMLHGCPVGSLCNELAKLGHDALPEATKLFALFRDWLAHNFAELGHEGDAEERAARSRLQPGRRHARDRLSRPGLCRARSRPHVRVGEGGKAPRLKRKGEDMFMIFLTFTEARTKAPGFTPSLGAKRLTFLLP